MKGRTRDIRGYLFKLGDSVRVKVSDEKMRTGTITDRAMRRRIGSESEIPIYLIDSGLGEWDWSEESEIIILFGEPETEEAEAEKKPSGAVSVFAAVVLSLAVIAVGIWLLLTG